MTGNCLMQLPLSLIGNQRNFLLGNPYYYYFANLSSALIKNIISTEVSSGTTKMG